MKNPILITGAARSGTSMTAGIINICGAWGGDMAGKTKHNQKGMFENNELRKINKSFLTSINCDPLGQHPLPKIGRVRDIAIDRHEDWRFKVKRIIEKQGYGNGCPWMYKGAKICLIWPMWFFAFQKAKWVIVRREKEGIIQSCLRTSFMRRCKGEEGWSAWVDHHLKRFIEIRAVSDNVYEVWANKIIAGDFSEIKNTIKALGLKWKEDEVRDFVDPKLWSGGRYGK